MTWKPTPGEHFEAGKIKYEIVPYTRGLGLDIGCGERKVYDHFIGVDNKKDERLFGFRMNPDFTVPDAKSLPMFSTESMDFVFSSHTLEHIKDHKATLAEWWRLVKVGGHMVLYLPHKDLYPNIGTEHANPDHVHDFTESDILDAMDEYGWDLIRNELRDQDDEYSFFQVFRKRADKEHTFPCNNPKPEKSVGIVRYGAWGDALQLTSALPELKKQGFHITLYTVPRAYEVLKDEPLIDEFVLQDNDQVPNRELGEFWKTLAKRHDRFVNLSESVEATWLATPWKISFHWPHEVRHKHLNYNYVQFQHELCGVPYKRCAVRFVPTLEERNVAAQRREELGNVPVILYTLAGSSVHKTWPYMDQIIARLMTTTKAKVVLVGDELCQMLELPWRAEPRVLMRSGIWGIRETLAFAQTCDLVFGPETGVMSSVCAEKMPKVVLLSHSSHENLTRDWLNTFAVHSTKTACYPCHLLHFNHDHCPQGKETGTAQCQEDISADQVWLAISQALKQYKPNKGLAMAA